MPDLSDMSIKSKQCEKCGATWINGQLYWSTGKEAKEIDLAGLVCNTVNSPQCLNPLKGKAGGDTWAKRRDELDKLMFRMDKEHDIQWDAGISGDEN